MRQLFHWYKQDEMATPAPATKALEMRLLQHKLANASSFYICGTGCPNTGYMHCRATSGRCSPLLESEHVSG